MIPALQPSAAYLQVLPMIHGTLIFGKDKHDIWLIRSQRHANKKKYPFLVIYDLSINRTLVSHRRNSIQKGTTRIKPLSKVGNPSHSSDVCMRVGHSPLYVDTSFHIAALDGKEPMNLQTNATEVRFNLSIKHPTIMCRPQISSYK